MVIVRFLLSVIHSLRISFVITSTFVLCFVLQLLGFFSECYGIIPLENRGLFGIITAPLIHADIWHLMGNCSALFLLIFISHLHYRKFFFQIFVSGWILTGLLVWLTPDLSFWKYHLHSCHIGASGLVYMLASFNFFSGIFSKTLSGMALSLLIIFLYGGLFWGIFPQEFFGVSSYHYNISWQSHAAGTIAGFWIAYHYANEIKKESKHLRKIKSASDSDNHYSDFIINDSDQSKDHEKKEDWRNFL